ncbi:hypothetical protein [Streptomyces sp. TE3672]
MPLKDCVVTTALVIWSTCLAASTLVRAVLLAQLRRAELRFGGLLLRLGGVAAGGGGLRRLSARDSLSAQRGHP